ncbi:Lipid A palmitoyltransferase PagP precursor|nr:Lipid A palmitoyltransferase PagP precursor [Candidatus Pantoea persica]
MNRYTVSTLTSARLRAYSLFLRSGSDQAVTVTQSIQSGWNSFPHNVQQTWEEPQNRRSLSARHYLA